ncbi:MAG: signal peptidase I [Proteobacteria bacterium]|nr:signal peptidase I [Pseudomonadota bacterium]
MKKLLEWAILILIATVVVIFTRIYLFQTFKIPTSSMEATLSPGDRILVNKFIYGLRIPGFLKKVAKVRQPERGDVVVFYRFSEFEDIDSNKHFVKRIVAVPGDKVEIVNFNTYVNGELAHREIKREDLEQLDNLDNFVQNMSEITISAEHYFVMGDNFLNSKDSRYFGEISLNDIEGKVEYIYWSWDPNRGNWSVNKDRVLKRVN